MLHGVYQSLMLLASATTTANSVRELRVAGVEVEREERQATLETLGNVRRFALDLGLRRSGSHLHLCDWDRLIHWAERYPDELRSVAAAIPRYDCLVLGRTERAFASHPRVQRDTEAIINHCFGLAAGRFWDVTAASRGFSRRAAELLVAECEESTVGNDCVWPLFLLRNEGLATSYLETEGLEWETADRHDDDIRAAGGIESWLAEHDSDLPRWVDRIRLAEIEVDAIRRFSLTST